MGLHSKPILKPIARANSSTRGQPHIIETKDTVRVCGSESFQECLFTGFSKVAFCGFGPKRVRLSDPGWIRSRSGGGGGPAASRSPTLTVLLVVPTIKGLETEGKCMLESQLDFQESMGGGSPMVEPSSRQSVSRKSLCSGRFIMSHMLVFFFFSSIDFLSIYLYLCSYPSSY